MCIRDRAYSLRAMMVDVRDGVWTELRDGDDVGPFRRNLQRGYLARMRHLMTVELDDRNVSEAYAEYVQDTPVTVAQSDIRALVRSELQALRTQVEQAAARTGDPTTEAHLDDVRVRIDRILDPADDAGQAARSR